MVGIKIKLSTGENRGDVGCQRKRKVLSLKNRELDGGPG